VQIIINNKYTNDDLLCLYAITGGVAKYVTTLMDIKAFTKGKMLKSFSDPTLSFISEGNRPDVYGVSQGQCHLSAYLATLENTYSIVQKRRPIFAKQDSKIVKYEICDNFLLFWERVGVSSHFDNRKKYIYDLVETGVLERTTIPDKPKDPNQKYRRKM